MFYAVLILWTVQEGKSLEKKKNRFKRLKLCSIALKVLQNKSISLLFFPFFEAQRLNNEGQKFSLRVIKRQMQNSKQINTLLLSCEVISTLLVNKFSDMPKKKKSFQFKIFHLFFCSSEASHTSRVQTLELSNIFLTSHNQQAPSSTKEEKKKKMNHKKRFYLNMYSFTVH